MTVRYLLDTNVVSELRKRVPDPRVLDWFDRHDQDDFYVSVLLMGEIRQGIARLRHRDPQRAHALDRWLTEMMSTYSERILPVTLKVALEWGYLNESSRHPPVIDGLMAATAKVHRLVLVTRNLKDFKLPGLTVVNPFDPAG